MHDLDFLKKTRQRFIWFGVVILILLLVYHTLFILDYIPYSLDFGLSGEFIGALLVWFVGLIFWKFIIDKEQTIKQTELLDSIKQTIQLTEHETIESVKQAVHSAILNLGNSGIISYHPEQPTDQIIELFKSAQKRIRILQSWLDDETRLMPSIREIAEKNSKITNDNLKVTIQILILNPDSYQTELRARSLGFSDKESAQYAIKRNASKIKQIQEIYPEGNIQLKHYDDLLSFSALIADDNCFCGWFWKGKEPNNRNKPYLQIKGEDSEMFLDMNEHFDCIWNEKQKGNR